MDKSLESWRRFFKGAETDICTVIEYAILVAICDSPIEFKRRRGEITQRLYTPACSNCSKCDSVTPAVRAGVNDCSTKPPWHPNSVQSKHGKVLEVEERGNSYSMEGDGNRASGISDGAAVAVNEGIEEANELLQEVVTIKRILDDTDETDEQVFQSLRKLERLQLTVEILRETGIGKSVRAVRKSRSSPAIRSIAKDLRSQWTLVVDEWVATTEAATDAGRDAAEPSGLPSPPLDEGAFITPHTTTEYIEKLFDDMGDDGNFNTPKEPSNDQCPSTTNEGTQQSHCKQNEQGRERNSEACASQSLRDTRDTIREALNKRSPAKVGLTDVRRKDSSPKGSLLKKDDTKKSPLSWLNKQSSSEEELKVIIEASKRKLQEGYRQAADAKRRRTVQAMAIEDIPKDLPKPQPNNTRPGFHHQQWRNRHRR